MISRQVARTSMPQSRKLSKDTIRSIRYQLPAIGFGIVSCSAFACCCISTNLFVPLLLRAALDVRCICAMSHQCALSCIVLSLCYSRSLLRFFRLFFGSLYVLQSRFGARHGHGFVPVVHPLYAMNLEVPVGRVPEQMAHLLQIVLTWFLVWQTPYVRERKVVGNGGGGRRCWLHRLFDVVRLGQNMKVHAILRP